MPASPKPEKLVPNLDLRSHIENLGCLIKDGCFGLVKCHHVKHRGSGGIDLFNMVPLCFCHHEELHRSRIAFEKKYNLPCLKSLAICFTVSFLGSQTAIEELARVRGIDMCSAEAIILVAIENVENKTREWVG